MRRPQRSYLLGLRLVLLALAVALALVVWAALFVPQPQPNYPSSSQPEVTA